MTVEGIDEPAVTRWFEANVPGATGPMEFELIAGGHSNLTYRVSDAAGNRYVLRRPPLGHVLATAHDMAREHRIISALAPTPVRVAPALGICEDDTVNGAPFYVMQFLDGLVLRTREAAEEALTPEQRRVAGESIVDVLADIHAVDPEAVGLGDLGRREGYITRQLKRWHGQWEKSKTRELATIDEVHERLASSIPEQGPAAIVHGDYRLDNTMLDFDGRVKAVFDWELCTLGEPMADLGVLMVYWTGPDDEDPAQRSSATRAAGFPNRDDMLARYAERSGRDVSDINYFTAFGYWKLACIIEGVYARYKHGAMGSGATDFDHFDAQVVRLADAAAATLEHHG